MTVGIFVDAYLPIKNGVVTSVNQLKAGLDALGHKVYIFTVRVPGGEDLPDVYRVPSIKFGKKSESMLGLVNLKKMIRLCRDLKVQLIHTHSEFTLGTAGRRVARALGLPAVHTTHTLWQYYKYYVLGGWPFFFIHLEWLLKRFLKGYKFAIAPSVKALDYFKPFVAPDLEFRLIPNGVDQSKFVTSQPSAEELKALRDSLGIQADDKVAIFTGRIGPEKRCVELLDSFLPVLKRNPHIRIMYVGQGSSVPVLQKTAHQHGVGGQVIFTGFVDWSQMHKYYGISQCFVTASISEVHPMTLIEAAIKGLPAVTKKDAAYQPLLEDGVNGWLCEQDADIGLKVEELFNNPKKLQAFSKSSSEKVQLYSAANHVKNVMAFYEHILAKHAQTQT